MDIMLQQATALSLKLTEHLSLIIFRISITKLTRSLHLSLRLVQEQQQNLTKLQMVMKMLKQLVLLRQTSRMLLVLLSHQPVVSVLRYSLQAVELLFSVLALPLSLKSV